MHAAAPNLQRRGLLAAIGGTLWTDWATATPSSCLVAAWQDDHQHHLGLLRAQPGAPVVAAHLALPSRAHGLLVETSGTVLAVARRPGDWLLRWRPGQGKAQEQAQWQWQEADRRLNGHVVAWGGRHLLTTETDRADGSGWLALRDRANLRTLRAWPTGGPDPHQLLVLPRAVGEFPAGTVLVANGGITNLPETGRSARQSGPLDASLVALSPQNGRPLGRWRLADPWLSIRHLAWHADSGQVGVALQAEHPAAPARQPAPVLAIWDGLALHPAVEQPPLAGYGGDIAAVGPTGYAVGCPRVDAVALFSMQGRFLGLCPLPGACALAAQAGGWWAGGQDRLHFTAHGARTPVDAPHTASAVPTVEHPAEATPRWSLDNHWGLWPHRHV